MKRKTDSKTAMRDACRSPLSLSIPILLFLSTGAIGLLALSGDRLPGLGYDLLSLLGMAQLALISGALMTATLSRTVRRQREVLGGVILATSAILHMVFYAKHGPGHPVPVTLEQIYIWGLAGASAILVAKSLLFRAGLQGAGLGLAGLVLVALQIPMHSYLAAPAAEAIYSRPYRVASHIDHTTALHQIGLAPYDRAILGISNPDDLESAASRLASSGMELRHSWTMSNPLPNLPKAELLVVYDGLADEPETWVLAPEDMAVHGLPLIYLHYVLTALSAFLIAGPAFFFRHRGKTCR